MRSRNFSVGLVTAVLAAFGVLGVAVCASGQQGQERVLHSFNGGDGYIPEGGLIFDASGNLYGTTSVWGKYGGGTLFELSPAVGGWKEKILHSFGSGTDGAYPYASLIFDSAGNLYGTTTIGGANNDSGTVFELIPHSDGSWTEK